MLAELAELHDTKGIGVAAQGVRIVRQYAERLPFSLILPSHPSGFVRAQQPSDSKIVVVTEHEWQDHSEVTGAILGFSARGLRLRPSFQPGRCTRAPSMAVWPPRGGNLRKGLSIRRDIKVLSALVASAAV